MSKESGYINVWLGQQSSGKKVLGIKKFSEFSAKRNFLIDKTMTAEPGSG